MKQISLTKTTIYGVVVILFVILGVFWWLSPKHNQSPEVADNNDTPVITQQENDMSDKITFGETEALKEIQAKYAPIEESLAQDLAVLRLEPITAADSAEVAQMLAKLEPIDAKSEAEIVQILIDFYPEEERDGHLFALYTRMYRDLEKDYDSSPTKEQKVLQMVHFAQETVSALREIEKSVAERGQKRMDLIRRDPDAYYASRIQEYEVKIQETEARIREAEARGDTDVAESERKHLAVLHEFMEDTKSDQKWEQGQEARIQEAVRKGMQEWEQNPPEWAKEHQRYMASVEELKAELATLKSRAASPVTASDAPVPLPTDVPVALPQESTVLPSDSYDPIKSLTSAQDTLRPWRSELDEDYFDVVASQYLTTEELQQFFPTQETREVLKRRTSEMQRAVVSKIREVVSEIPNATAEQKRKLARELVTKNFDKDFAEAVLSELEKDAE